MRTARRFESSALCVLCGILALFVPDLGARAAAPQTQIDAVVFRFGDQVITLIDVRQARQLKLVRPSGDSDQAFIDAIVNRRLVLSELNRSPPADPGSEASELRRREWERDIGGNAAELLERAGMSDAALRGWLRDDLRIESYLAARFGDVPTRSREIDGWVQMLRQRAGIR